jgi:hypothetical protein
MKVRRIFRANQKSATERAREKVLRDEIQRKRPSLDDLVDAGECDADAIMTMGMYFDIQSAIQSLKRERVRVGLSIGDVADRSGLDRAVVSRLENGKQDNPTVATLMRYAAAIGKRLFWSYGDSPANGPSKRGKAVKRRGSRLA